MAQVALTLALTLAYTLVHTLAHTLARTRAHTLVHMQVHTRAHTYTYTYTSDLAPRGCKLVYNTGRSLKDYKALCADWDLIVPDAFVGGCGTQVYT